MDWIHQYRLFLFDFDGLLVNTEDLHFAAYVEMCRQQGYALTWDFTQFCLAAHYESTGLRDAIYGEFPELQEKEPRWEVLYVEKKRIYLELLKENRLHLMPGVEELLIALERASIRRCVATNSALEQIEEIKKALPILKTIPTWITRENYTKAKPAPDAYLAAIKQVAEAGDEKAMIGFEDSTRGLKALQAAGVRPVLICPPLHPQLQDPALKDVAVYHSFEDIPPLTGPYA